jgi:hypothetical protein
LSIRDGVDDRSESGARESDPLDDLAADLEVNDDASGSQLSRPEHENVIGSDPNVPHDNALLWFANHHPHKFPR